MKPAKTIAFVGIGNMGTPMATNLVKAGFDVVLFDAAPKAAADFVAQHGGRAASTLAEAASAADVAITMLPSDAALRQVVLGAGGLAAALPRGATVIDMGSSNPHSTVQVGEALAKKGLDFIDAPVMGGVAFANTATLEIMAGGREDAIQRCLPVLQAMGEKVTRCGALGSGHALKALANYVNACALINTLEAMTIGQKFGLDVDVMTAALRSMCMGRQAPLEKKVVPHVLTRKFATGMKLGLIAKDISIVTDLAHSIEAAAPLAERVRDIWAEAAGTLGADVDQTEIVKLWEQRSGVTL